MTEKDYIFLLDEALRVRGIVERHDILADYRQHFSDGRAAGQSDDDIVRQLGLPDEVAKEYLPNNGPPTFDPPPAIVEKRRLWPLVAFIAILCISLSALIVALNRRPIFVSYAPPVTHMPAPPASPPTPTPPPAPDAPHQGRIRDYVSDIMDEVREGLSALSNIDWNVGVSVGNNLLDAAYKTLEYSQVFNSVDSVRVDASWNLGCAFRLSPDSSAHVELSGEIPEAHDVFVTLENGLLTIKYDSHGVNNLLLGSITASFNRKSLATVYLPKNWDGVADVNILNGNISVDDGLSFASLTAGSVSGDINAKNSSFGALAVKATSGDISLSDIHVNELTANAVSGDISVRLPVQPRTMTLSATAGDITLRMDGAYRFSFSSVAGRLRNDSQGYKDSGGYIFKTIAGDLLLSNY